MHSSNDGIALTRLARGEAVETSHVSGARPALTRCDTGFYTAVAFRRAS